MRQLKTKPNSQAQVIKWSGLLTQGQKKSFKRNKNLLYILTYTVFKYLLWIHS